MKLEKEQKNRLAREEEEASLAAKSWEASQVSENVSTDDEDEIFAKLAKIALFWDAGSELNAQKLQHFNCFLNPYQFKRQLELSLGLKSHTRRNGRSSSAIQDQRREFCVDGKAFLSHLTNSAEIAPPSTKRYSRVMPSVSRKYARWGNKRRTTALWVGRICKRLM